MPTPLQDWSWRPAVATDVDALTAMLDVATRAFLDRPTTTDETADRLALPGCSLPVDSVLVPGGHGGVIGFAQVFATPPSDVRAFARVHPDARGQGLGTALARWAVDRAGQVAASMGQQTVRYSTTAWAADADASGVLRAAGLREVRHFLRMVTELPASTAPVQPGHGVTLDAYVPAADDEGLFAAFRDSFAEHWGQEHPEEAGFWWDERDSPGSAYDPSLWTVARGNGEIVGFTTARTRERQGRAEGYVSAIGVRPSWRSKRVGQALLSHTLRLFADRGLKAASLDVDADNVTDALRLYRSVGMTAEPSFTIWGTDLSVS
jgi:mycothiol synthase